MGYSGSSTTVYRFAKDWREEQSQPRGAGFVPMHFELSEAFQFNWNCEYLVIGGLRRRLDVAHIILAASRAYLLVAYFTQTHEMVFDSHARGFAVFEGVAKRGVYDNMRTAVDKVGHGKERIVNARFEWKRPFSRLPYTTALSLNRHSELSTSMYYKLLVILLF